MAGCRVGPGGGDKGDTESGVESDGVVVSLVTIDDNGLPLRRRARARRALAPTAVGRCGCLRGGGWRA